MIGFGDSLVGGTVVRLLKLVDIPVFLARGPEKASFSEILVGTDFSEAAKRAAMLSMSWFPKASHKIVHAYHVAFEGFLRMSGATEDRIESLRQEAFSIAKQQMQEQLRSLDPEEQIDGVMLHGYPAIALLREIDHSGVELAVIGSYCGSTLEDRPLGKCYAQFALPRAQQRTLCSVAECRASGNAIR